jgi:hypothetical protein
MTIVPDHRSAVMYATHPLGCGPPLRIVSTQSLSAPTVA